MDHDVGTIAEARQGLRGVDIPHHDFRRRVSPERVDGVAACENPHTPAVLSQLAHDPATEEPRGSRNRCEPPGQAGSSCWKAPAMNSSLALERDSLPEDV